MSDRIRIRDDEGGIVDEWKTFADEARSVLGARATQADVLRFCIAQARLAMGGAQVAPRWHPPGAQVAPTRHPGGTHPGHRWHPPGTQPTPVPRTGAPARVFSSSSSNIEEEEEIAAHDTGGVSTMAGVVAEAINTSEAVTSWGTIKRARSSSVKKLEGTMRQHPHVTLEEWLAAVKAWTQLQRSQLQFVGDSLTQVLRDSPKYGGPMLLVAHCYEAKDQPNPPTVADVAADESVKVTWSQVPASGRVAETSEHKQRYCTVMQREAPAVYWGLYEAAKTRAEMYYRRGFRGQRLVTAVADRGTWDVWRKWRGVIAPIVARAIEEVENGAQADEGGRDSGDADAAAGDAADGRPDAMEAHGAGGEGDGAGGGRHLLGGVDVADAAHHGGGAEAKADIRDFRAHVRGFLENR